MDTLASGNDSASAGRIVIREEAAVEGTTGNNEGESPEAIPPPLQHTLATLRPKIRFRSYRANQYPTLTMTLVYASSNG